MSQWNNSYSYNNQYHTPNNWNGDYNNQYQAYYPNAQYNANQYVSFDEFLSQMHISNPQTNPYNTQYPNYPNSQYSQLPNYQNDSPNQNSQAVYNYETSSSNYNYNNETYQGNTEEQIQQTSIDQQLPREVVKSKLMPTATEFVPKQSSTSNKEQHSSNTNRNAGDSNNSKPSGSTNWRERPQNSKNSFTSESSNFYQKNVRPQELNNRHNKYDSKYRNQDNQNTNGESSGQNSANPVNKDRPSDANNRKGKSKSRPFENNQNSEPSFRNQYNQGYNNQSKPKNRTYNGCNHESNHNEDINDISSASELPENSNSDEGGQSKSNSKFKSKDSDPSRTFYNSGMPKESQDVRNGRSEGSGRNRRWIGSQRLKGAERDIYDDEQYAKSYFHAKEERNRDNLSSPAKGKSKNLSNPGANIDMTQRERLSDQLDRGTLECLVCCERVKQTDPVWYCGNCYHVLHLRCIRKWAISSMIETKWRCPACQNVNQDIPHPCTLLCHPGPCPPCQATISKQCGCGAETRSVLCSSKLPQVCGRVCNKKLECGVHSCTKQCHEEQCDPCEEIVTQVCHCPAAKSRSVACTSHTDRTSWSCGEQCGRVLSCGAHVCRATCHAPPCPACPLTPDNVPACPCGKTRINKDQRKTCVDPIPLCGNICAKPLPCGPAGDKHICKESCHEGGCRVCPDTTLLQCRCGHSSQEVPCADLPQMINNVLCQRKCNKKLSCGRHRCHTRCCDSATHRCAVVCGRSLSCQLHRCEEFCHTGHCAPCPRVSFDELHCECGAEVLMPPVRCGTKPPACSAPCRRSRPCGHPPHHSCHSGDCPPCVVLTTKMCYGKHEERKTIPCSQEEFSCGLPCGKPLPCGKHTCIKICHKGSCDISTCSQPCTSKRPSCGHPCAARCHSSGGGSCPSPAPCRRPVRATCQCGRKQTERSCCDNARDYAKMMSTLAATKMQEGGTVDISDVQRPGSMLKTLECDEECFVEARSRRLALALQLRNPDVSAKLAPRYSDHLRTTAAREPTFAQQIHDKLTELVQLAKKSKQKTRAHSFPSMNRQKRQFIHELCEHFGCESVAYDAEPNRNVVATADKEKSWLPAMSVLEVLSREAGKRRVPGPVLRAPAAALPPTKEIPSTTSKSSSGGWATLTSTNAWAARSQPKKEETKIDYFDNPPE
ncbi:putative shuttle craft [Danaus plexippus plexippus]|uniref:Shuttle craft n=1 Tax=Danaus plexippus plexippus TaxID=278856 RepID=A0A212EP74_DANPL|nr:putative shuttle craft [Danaus plexippus plexippus]